MNDFESAEVAVVENVQRKDLTAIEEARSFKSLLDKGYMTQEDLAKKMGLSQAAISNKLRLLNLDQTVQDAVLQEKISERHARSLLKIKNQDEQKKMLQRIIEERLTVRQLEEEIKKMIGNNGQDEEVPIVNGPDLKSMINNAVDITPVKPVASEEQKDLDLAMDNTPKVDIAPVNNGFPSAQSMPNKFFNFLEDEAANMSMEEKTVPIINPVEEKAVDNSKLPSMEDILNNTDGIEMLDDFIIPSVKEDKSVTDNTFLNDIIATIRNLHLDSDKVKVEEINLPTEYKINITIKKDKI